MPNHNRTSLASAYRSVRQGVETPVEAPAEPTIGTPNGKQRVVMVFDHPTELERPFISWKGQLFDLVRIDS